MGSQLRTDSHNAWKCGIRTVIIASSDPCTRSCQHGDQTLVTFRVGETGTADLLLRSASAMAHDPSHSSGDA